ncbi:MAG: hypothetical protein AABN95_08300 [Acidobacteriota bacterium]
MDQNTLWTLVGFVLAAISFLLNVFLGISKTGLQNKLVALEERCARLDTQGTQHQLRLTQFQEYAKRTRVIQPRYLDVILLGPRGSGKTVLSKLWRAPFTEIDRIEATQDVWITHDIAVYEGEEFPEQDDLFGVSRTHLLQYRLRIRDYAGEDQYKREALDALKANSQTALIFFVPCIHARDMDAVVSLPSLREACQRNSDYFNSHFINQMAKLPRLAQNVARAFVVFSRVDQLPDSETLRIGKVEEMHEPLLDHFRTTFGKDLLNVWHISARTNANTFNLLGSITKIFFDGADLPPQLKERIEGATQLAYDFTRGR